MLISMRGGTKVARGLKKIGARLSNPLPLMRTIATYQLRSTQLNFRTESFDGTAWPALAEVTTQAKITARHRRGRRKKLRPTGKHLYQRLSSEASKQHAAVKCAQGWAWVHNYGAPLRHGRLLMPQRQFMGITKKDREEILGVSDRYAKKVLSDAFQ